MIRRLWRSLVKAGPVHKVPRAYDIIDGDALAYAKREIRDLKDENARLSRELVSADARIANLNLVIKAQRMALAELQAGKCAHG